MGTTRTFVLGKMGLCKVHYGKSKVTSLAEEGASTERGKDQLIKNGQAIGGGGKEKSQSSLAEQRNGKGETTGSINEGDSEVFLYRKGSKSRGGRSTTEEAP